jgi:hypothetical protein
VLAGLPRHCARIVPAPTAGRKRRIRCTGRPIGRFPDPNQTEG